MTEKVQKSLDDLTLEEIKAQLSIFQTLYQKKRRQVDSVYREKEKERWRKKYYLKKEKENDGEKKTGNKKYDHSKIILVDVDVVK